MLRGYICLEFKKNDIFRKSDTNINYNYININLNRYGMLCKHIYYLNFELETHFF